MKFKSLLVEAMMYLMTDIDEEELMGELDALEADVGMETEGDGVPACVHPDLEEELILPPAPTGHAAPAVPAGRVNQDTMIEPCRSSITMTSLANPCYAEFSYRKDSVKGKKYKMNRCFMNAIRVCLYRKIGDFLNGRSDFPMKRDNSFIEQVQ